MTLDIVYDTPTSTKPWRGIRSCHPALVAGSPADLIGRCRNKCGMTNMDKTYYVYVLTNTHRTVFYTGVTNNLLRRAYEHKERLVDGFTKRYNIHKLIYFEQTPDVQAALHREKLVKKWKREFKFDAINRMNPEWKDLYLDMQETPQQVRGDSIA